MEAESLSAAKRKALQLSVASLCVESGYLSAERGAVEVLTQTLQAYITEVGRTSRVYCETAQRLEPTVSDIHLALIDVGSKYNSLETYAKRLPRRHISRQLRNFPTPQPKSLQVGSKVQRPSHIPPYLPPLPDQHTYVKTPIFLSPEIDYRAVKEKLSSQRYHSTKSLSKLLAKTKPSRPIAGEVDESGMYSVLLPEIPTDKPVYISALIPSLEEDTDTSGGTPLKDDSSTPPNNTADQQPGSSSVELDKTEDAEDRETRYVNPYLKQPVKPIISSNT